MRTIRRKIDRRGYVRVTGLFGGEWEYEHTIVARKKLGRALKPNETVHHINEIKSDNRPENIRVWERSPHIAHHNRTAPKRKKSAGLSAPGSASPLLTTNGDSDGRGSTA